MLFLICFVLFLCFWTPRRCICELHVLSSCNSSKHKINRAICSSSPLCLHCAFVFVKHSNWWLYCGSTNEHCRIYFVESLFISFVVLKYDIWIWFLFKSSLKIWWVMQFMGYLIPMLVYIMAEIVFPKFWK